MQLRISINLKLSWKFLMNSIVIVAFYDCFFLPWKISFLFSLHKHHRSLACKNFNFSSSKKPSALFRNFSPILKIRINSGKVFLCYWVSLQNELWIADISYFSRKMKSFSRILCCSLWSRWRMKSGVREWSGVLWKIYMKHEQLGMWSGSSLRNKKL